jgi:hypothetical protein
MKQMMIMALAACLTLQQGIALCAEPVTVPQGTPVIVKLLETVSSATHKKGDSISLAVVGDVLVNGKKVIASGTPVKGTVESAAKRFIAGIGGQIEISVNEVKAEDGTLVPLKFTKETHNGSTLVAAVVAVICCCCFWLIPGKDVTIDKDSLFDAATLSPVNINVQ